MAAQTPAPEQITDALASLAEPAAGEELAPVEALTQTLIQLGNGVIERLPYLGIAVVLIFITAVFAAFVAKFSEKALMRAHMRRELVTLFTNMSSIFIWLLGIAIATVVVIPSVTPAKLLAGLGIGGIAVGFAFKDIFENFLAGVIILFRKEMRIGDFIECEGVEGDVEKISIRETHVRQKDGQLVIAPNAMLFTNPVFIRTDLKLRREELVVGVDYATDLSKAADALNAALQSCETVSSEKETEVKLISFGGSSIDFKILWWTGSAPKDQRASFDEVAFAVKRELDAAGITIPFPQVTLSAREVLRFTGPGSD